MSTKISRSNNSYATSLGYLENLVSPLEARAKLASLYGSTKFSGHSLDSLLTQNPACRTRCECVCRCTAGSTSRGHVALHLLPAPNSCGTLLAPTCGLKIATRSATHFAFALGEALSNRITMHHRRGLYLSAGVAPASNALSTPVVKTGRSCTRLFPGLTSSFVRSST